jgi:hypothetical protein
MVVEGEWRNIKSNGSRRRVEKYQIQWYRGFKVFYNRRYFLNFRRYLKNSSTTIGFDISPLSFYYHWI